MARVSFESVARARPAFHHLGLEFRWEVYQTQELNVDGHEYVIVSEGYVLRGQDLFGFVLGRVFVKESSGGTRWGWDNADYVWDWKHDLPTWFTHASAMNFDTPGAAMDAFQECVRAQCLRPIGVGTVVDRVPVVLGDRQFMWVEIGRLGERRFFLRSEHYGVQAAEAFQSRPSRAEPERDCGAVGLHQWFYEVRMNWVTHSGWAATPAHAMDVAEREVLRDLYQRYLQTENKREAEAAVLPEHERARRHGMDDMEEGAEAEREPRHEDECESLGEQSRRKWGRVRASQAPERPLVNVGGRVFEWQRRDLGPLMMHYLLKSQDVLGTELGQVWYRLDDEEPFWEWSTFDLRLGTCARNLDNEPRRFTSLESALDEFEAFIQEHAIQELARECLAKRAPVCVDDTKYVWVVDEFLDASYYLRCGHYSNTLATVIEDHIAPPERRWEFNVILAGQPFHTKSGYSSAADALADCEDFLRTASFLDGRQKVVAQG